MSRWFRMYDEALDDPKVRMLPPALFKTWVNLLMLASRHDGQLPDLTAMAFSLRMMEDEMSAALEALQARGLIDLGETGYHPHNWNGRQFKSDVSTERVKRFRNAKAAVSVTPPDTDTETDTEKGLVGSEGKPSSPTPPKRKRVRGGISYHPSFEILWDQFPYQPNASKQQAFLAWQKLPEEDRDKCLDGAMAYVDFLDEARRRRPDAPGLHLATYINQRRWEALLEKR